MKALLFRVRAAVGRGLLLAGLAATPALAQNVGIGTTAPTQTLDVNGNLRVRAAAGTGTGRLLGVAADGTLQVQPPLFGATATASPQAPTALGGLATTDGEPVKVRVNPAGTRAYVLTNISASAPVPPSGQRQGSLQTFDLSGPTPVPVGGPVLLLSTGSDLALNPAGTWAWVVAGNFPTGAIQGFDLTQGPPVALGAAAIPDGAGDMPLAVNPAGTRAFVGNATGELLTFDLSQGGTPVLVNRLQNISYRYLNLAVNPAGTRLFAIDGNQMDTYDISSGLPVALGSPVSSGGSSYPREVIVSPDGTRAYVFSEGYFRVPNVLQTYDISSGLPVALGNPANTNGHLSFGLTGSANGAVLALLNSVGQTLQLYDKDSNGQAVARGGAVSLDGQYTESVALSPDGTRAYLTRSDNTLRTLLLAAPRVLAVGSDGSLGSVDFSLLRDNLGNHTATRHLSLDRHQLVGNGSSTGLSITAAGNTNIGTGQLVGNGSSTGLAISSDGQVGVGTTTPAAPLDVQGGALLTRTSVGTATQLRLTRPSVPGDKWPGSAELAVGTYAAGLGSMSRLDFRLGLNNNNVANQTVLTLRGDGHLGVGTAEPASQLANTSQNIIGSDQFGVGGRSLTWGCNEQGYAVAFYNDFGAAFGGGGLAVKVASAAAATAALDVSQGAGSAVVGATLLRVRADGNVGIGVGAPSARLDVAGSTRLRGLAAGVVVADASGNLSSGGDVRLGAGTPRGRLDVPGGDSYLVADANSGSSQSLYLPGHLWLAPHSGSSGTAYVQARVPNATAGTRIGLTLRTSNGTNLVDALTLAPDGAAALAGPLSTPAVTATTLNATTVSTSTANATTVNATTVATGTVTTAATGAANMLAAGYGNVFGTGTLSRASGNVTVAHTAGTGEYTLTFTGPLATADFGSTAVALTLFNGPGFISYTSGGAAGRLLVRAYNAAGILTDRGFSFVIFQP